MNNVCKCRCHYKNNNTMYWCGCFCCNISETKYIEDDGTIDDVTLFRICHSEPPRKNKRISKKNLNVKLNKE